MKHFFLIAISVLFIGCGSDSDILTILDTNLTSETGKQEQVSSTSSRYNKYWGSWRNISTDETLYITTKEKLEIEEIEENLIKVGSDYYLRDGDRNVKLKGKLYSENSELGRKLKTGYADIASIDLIIQNVLDENIEAEVSTDANGSFEDSSLPTGDYILKVTDNETNLTTEANITLASQDENIGSFKLVPKGSPNFKVNFILENSRVIYADQKEYNGSIIVRNTGYGMGTGLHFNIILHDARSFEKGSVLGSIPVGGKKVVPVKFSFNEQYENMKFYDLTVEIVDANNRRWIEVLQIPVHKGFFNLALKSEKSIRGLIKAPNGISIPFSEKNSKIKLPLLSPDEVYDVIFTNYHNLKAETKYALAVESRLKNYDDFEETSIFEPNNNKDEATALTLGDSIVSYLHFNDVDYFRIVVPEDLNKTFLELHNVEYEENSPEKEQTELTPPPELSNIEE